MKLVARTFLSQTDTVNLVSRFANSYLRRYDNNFLQFQHGLLEWRNIPNSSGYSPAECFSQDVKEPNYQRCLSLSIQLTGRKLFLLVIRNELEQSEDLTNIL